MVKGLYTAYTGMVNEQNRMDIMTNNLANASTVGYKKEGSTSQSFNDVLTVKIKDQSVGMRNVQRIGIKNPGVKIGENYTDCTITRQLKTTSKQRRNSSMICRRASSA